VRVLVDANLFISFLLTPDRESASNEVIRKAVLGEFTLLVPEGLLEEISSSARRKRYLLERIGPGEVDELMEILSSMAEFVPEIEEPIPAVVRDPKDDYLLAYAVVGEADYLVSGDRDLLVLKEVEGVRILSPREFLRTLGEG